MPPVDNQKPKLKLKRRPVKDDKSAADLGRAKTYVAQQQSAAAKDTKAQADLKRGDALKQTTSYVGALRKASDTRGFDPKNANAKLQPIGKPAQDRPRSDQEYKTFLKTGQRPTRQGVRLIQRAPVQERLVAPGLRLLKESTRTLHGSAETVNEVLKGQRVDRALKKGGQAFLKNKGVTYSDVLKTAGVKNKTLRTAGGFVLDMVADPGTGAKLSRLAPKVKLEQRASEAEVRANRAESTRTVGKVTVKPAQPKKAVKLRAKAQGLRDKASTASETRGVQAGYSAKVPFGPRVEVMTKGRVTAKVGKKVAPVAERVRSTRPVQAVGQAFDPTFRATGVSSAEHAAATYAERKKRARTGAGDRKARRRGQAHARAAKGVNTDEMIAGVERAMVNPPLKTKVVRRKAEPHKAVKRLERKVQAQKTKEARERGRAELLAGQSDQRTLRQALIIVKKEAGPLKGGTKNLDAEAAKLAKPSGLSARGEFLAKRMRAAKAKLGQPAAEALHDFQGATAARNKASRELTAARKGHRNAHEGARSLYSDAQRAAATKRLTSAEQGMRAAKETYRYAEGRLRSAAEVPAAYYGEQALKDMGALDKSLAGLGRKPARPLGRLEKARHTLEGTKAELAAARDAAKGVPKTVSHRIDAATGRPYSAIRQEAIQAGQVKTVGGLPPKARKVAEATQAELDALKTRQKDAGVLPGELPDYYPHRLPPPTKTEKVKRLVNPARAARNPHAKVRKDKRPIQEIHAERGKVFSTDHGTVIAEYTQKAERAIADAKYLGEIKAIGKPLNQQTWAKRRPTDALYRITPTGVTKVEKAGGRELDAADAQRLIDSGEDVTVLPRSIGDSTLRGGGRGARPEIIRYLNRPVQWWKTAATILNIPFYQERNFYDDSFRAWMGDTPLSAFGRAARLVKDQALFERRQRTKLQPRDITGVVTVGGKKMSRADLLRQAEEDGAVRTGFFASDDLPEESLKPKTGVRRAAQPVQKLRQYSQNGEDVPKLAAYIAARDRGLTRAEAAAHVRLYMFDYDELTDLERAIRLAIPFYTYTRKNTALQARMAVSRPGKLAAVQKVREESAKLAGVDPNVDANLNEADQRALPVIGPDGNIYYSPLGITDTNRIPFATTWEQAKKLPGQQFDLFMQMLGPHVKVPVELHQNYSFFFRDAIYRSAKEPNAERWVPAPGWAKGAGIPTVKRPIDGKDVDAWPAKVDYIIRALGPQLGLLANVQNPVRNARGQSMGDMAFKQATGVRRSNLEDRLLAGALERASKKLGDINAKIADIGDLDPEGKKGLRSADGFFYSRGYQQLVDERARLQEVIKTLKAARTGAKPKDAVRLQRRPVPPAEAYKAKLKKLKTSDPAAEYRLKIERYKAKQKLLRKP